MNKRSRRSTARDHERAVRERPRYDLRLYISGMTLRSNLAVESVRAICEEFLPGRYRLEVIDIYQDPRKVQEDQVFAAPTLVKRMPRPTKLLVGDMSNRVRVLAGLNLGG